MVALRDFGNALPRDDACLGERAARKPRDERRALLVRVDAVGREVRGARRRPREAARGRGKQPMQRPIGARAPREAVGLCVETNDGVA